MTDLSKIIQFLPYLVPVVVLELILLVAAVLDWVKRPKTRGNRWVWLIVILFINTLGPIIYFLFGRGEETVQE